MDILFFLCLLLFGVAYASLKILKEQNADQSSKRIPALIGGIAAWSLVALLIVAIIKLSIFVAFVMSHEARDVQGEIFSLVLGLIAALMLIVMAYRFSQFVELWNIKRFFIQSLTFRGYDLVRRDIFADLEREKTRNVYDDHSTGAVANEQTPTKLKTPEQIRALQEELKRAGRQESRAAVIDRGARLAKLRSGEPVDLTDSWKLNAMTSSSHVWYMDVIDARLDPGSKFLLLSVSRSDVDSQRLADRVHYFRFKQEVYHFLLVVATEARLAPYRPFFNSLDVTVINAATTGFEKTAGFPFFRVRILIDELRKREGQFFDVSRLETIGKVDFQDGDVITV